MYYVEIIPIMNNKKEIKALTGLRFLAALMVLLFHSGSGFIAGISENKFIINILNNGFLGVSFFFILSGYILTYNYQSNNFDYRKYAYARISRVYPVYFLSLAVAMPLVIHKLDYFDIASTLMMIQSWVPYWSGHGYVWVMQAWTISVEFFFYIFFPIIIFSINKLTKNIIYLLLIFVISIMIAYGLPTIHPGEQRFDLGNLPDMVILPILRFPEFIYGSLLCKIMMIYKNDFNRIDDKYFFLFTLILLTILLLVLSCNTINNFSYLTIASVVFGILLILLTFEKSIFSRFLGSKLMVILGSASYSEYLLQGPIREWFKFFYLDSIIFRIIYPLFLIIISIIVYYCYENPAKKLIIKLLKNN